MGGVLWTQCFSFRLFSVKLKPRLPELHQIFPINFLGVWDQLSVVWICDYSVAKNQPPVQFFMGSFCCCLMCSTDSRGAKKKDALMITRASSLYCPCLWCTSCLFTRSFLSQKWLYLSSKPLSVAVMRQKATAMKQVNPSRNHDLKVKAEWAHIFWGWRIMLWNCENSGIILLKNKNKEIR